jgi:hypothetical protein
MAQRIKLLIEEKVGRKIRYPKDCDALAKEITLSSGSRISASTIKRLFGFNSGGGSPSMYTLDIVSQYLGYIDWDDLQLNLESEEDSHFLDKDLLLLRSAEIEAGIVLEIGYAKRRKLELRCLGDNCFQVINSEKTEIRVNDSLEIFLIWERLPLYVSSIVREGKNLGAFILEKKKGIDYIILKGSSGKK